MDVVVVLLGVLVVCLWAVVFRKLTKMNGSSADAESLKAQNADLQNKLSNAQADLRAAQDRLLLQKENFERELKIREEQECKAAAEREARERRAEEERAERERKLEAERAERERKAEEERAERERKLEAERAERERKAEEERAERERAAERERLEREKVAKAEREAAWLKQLDLMKSQFEATSQRLLKERSMDLQGINKEQLSNITAPFMKELETLRKTISDTKEGSDKSMTELGATIKAVMDRSEQMSKDTQNLAEALKNRGKVQGDWGEQVLANILRDSGLREGVEYSLQKSVKGESGNDLRPDVIVHCADGSNIIVDSKVSLTAYSDYIAAEDDAARELASKENLDSVWKHVVELSNKNYKKVVQNAVPMVLMFVPNEGSYILAMNRDPQIGQKAYQKGVIIINPTNLMLALSLIVQTWRNTRQEDNCKAILAAAEGIYEKYCTLSETAAKLCSQLKTAQNSSEDLIKQMKDGKGNLSSRISGLLKLGVTSTKVIHENVASVIEE